MGTNNDAIAAAQEAGLPDELLDAIQTAARQPEGRAARVLVVTSKDAEIVRKLLALKIHAPMR